MRWTVGTKIGAGFGLALAILVAIGSVSYRSTVQLNDTATLVAHTHEVLATLEAVLADLIGAETGQRGFILTGEESYLEPFRSAETAIDMDVAKLRDLTRDNPAQQRRLDVLERRISGDGGRIPTMRETIDTRRDPAAGFAAALQVVLTGNGKTDMDEIRGLIAEMKGEENALLAQRSTQAEATAANTKLVIVLGTLAASLILAMAGFAITRNIANPLQGLTLVAEGITAGDLSVRVDTDARADEVGVLARAFDRMTHSLRHIAGVAESIAAGDLRAEVKPQSPNDVLGNALAGMVAGLREQTRQLLEGAQVVGSAANEIVASTTQLASSASESAAAVSETTATVEEVRQTAQLASQKAKNVSDSAQRAAQTSIGGRKATEDVSAGMNRIRQQMDAIGAHMERLSAQSQAIGQIVATVEDLAAQSNLLSVNAAIEAAKAGDHGKGFGVVAQEVKSLAEQSRQATTQVRSILGEIQNATAAAVLAAEQGNKAVEAGTRQTEVAADSLQSLSGAVADAAQAATQIAVSSQQQMVGVDQVAGAMGSLRQASVQNVASAQQLETAARNLNTVGQRLKTMVERYRV